MQKSHPLMSKKQKHPVIARSVPQRRSNPLSHKTATSLGLDTAKEHRLLDHRAARGDIWIGNGILVWPHFALLPTQLPMWSCLLKFYLEGKSIGGGFPQRASADLSIFPAHFLRLAPLRGGDPHPRHPVYSQGLALSSQLDCAVFTSFCEQNEILYHLNHWGWEGHSPVQ